MAFGKPGVNVSERILTVREHALGRLTLMQQVDGGVPTDLQGPLFGSRDQAGFYKAMAYYVVELESAGEQIRSFRPSISLKSWAIFVWLISVGLVREVN